MSNATFARNRLGPMPTDAQMPVSRKTVSISMTAISLGVFYIEPQVGGHVQKALVDGIDMNVLRTDKFEINGVDIAETSI
jgi:hypothetical protein